MELYAFTFMSLLKLVDVWSTCKKASASMPKCRETDSDLFVSSSLMDMYAKCGSTNDATSAFDRLFQRDVLPWNVMLAA